MVKFEDIEFDEWTIAISPMTEGYVSKIEKDTAESLIYLLDMFNICVPF